MFFLSKFNLSKIKNINIISILLLVAIFTSSMTSLRFYGRVGISEILFVIVYFFLIQIYLKNILSIKYDLLNLIKFLLFGIFFIVSPINFFFNTNIYNLNFDILVYPFSFFIIFITVYDNEKILNFKFITRSFYKSLLPFFLISFIIYIFVYYNFFKLHGINIQFSGLSNNPNQFAFYLLVYLYFISLYYKEKFFNFFLFSLVAGFATQSEAFVISYTFLIILIIFNMISKKLSNKNFFFSILFVFIIIIFFSFYFQIIDYLIHYFKEEKITRLNLILDSLSLISENIFKGFGPGAFVSLENSGENLVFYEAHNTILDYSIQFGIIVPIIVYLIITYSTYIMFKKKDFFPCFTLWSIIIFSQFHYIGRHFIFYLILGITIIYIKKNFKKKLI